MSQDIKITQKTYDSNIIGAVFSGYIQTVLDTPV